MMCDALDFQKKRKFLINVSTVFLLNIKTLVIWYDIRRFTTSRVLRKWKFLKKKLCRFNMHFFLGKHGRIRYETYLKSACVEKKSWYFDQFFYKKILIIKITVAVYHPIGMYICTNPWDIPLAKYTPCGCVFCLGTDPLGLIHIVLLPNMRRLWDKFEHSITD